MCEITESGDKIWRNENGNIHIENDLPAIKCANGTKMWFKKGQYHRLGGLPAIELHNGIKMYYIFNRGHLYDKIPKSYKTLVKFGRFCLRKIKLNRVIKSKQINNQLLCMPPNSKYIGGQYYLKALMWFL